MAWQEENHDHGEEAHAIAKKRLAEGKLDGIYVTARGPFGAAIGQNPFAQGYRSVKAAYDLLKSGKGPANPVERVNLEIAVRENVDYLETR